MCALDIFTPFYLPPYSTPSASLVDQTVKNLPALREIWVLSLGWEDPLEEGMATHSSILAWRIPKDRGACWATVHGVAKESDMAKQAHKKLHNNGQISALFIPSHPSP